MRLRISYFPSRTVPGPGPETEPGCPLSFGMEVPSPEQDNAVRRHNQSFPAAGALMPEEITRRAMPFVDAPPEEACLVLIYGAPELGKRFALGGETLIGRDPGNTIP